MTGYQYFQILKKNGSCVKMKAPTHTLPTASMMVGIAVSNEEQNIGNLLENLDKCSLPEIETICIVSSGSTDKTNEIVRSYSQNDARIQLIIEPERNGKSSALNILLAESENYDFVCLYWWR